MRNSLFHLLFALFGAGLLYAQSNSLNSTNPGVVVSVVDKNSEAEEAGLRPGDRILTWERGKEGGPVPEPFTFRDMSMEQAPRGPVTLHGNRSGNALTWVVKTDNFRYDSISVWGVRVVGGWSDAASVIQQIESLDRAGKYPELIEYCRSECAKFTKNDAERPYLNSLAAYFLIKANRFRESDDFVQKALADKPDSPSLVTVGLYEEAADSKGFAGDMEPALHFWIEARRELALLRPPGLHDAFALTMMSLTEMDLGKYPEASQFARKAVAMTNALAPRSLLYAHCLLVAGQAALLADDLEAAASSTPKGLAIAEATRPASEFTADAYNVAGRLAWRLGDVNSAERDFSKSLQIMSKLSPSPDVTLESLGWLARVEAERGNFVRAERFMNRFTAVLDKRRDWQFVGGVLLNLAALKLQNGEPVEAARLARQALDVYKGVAPQSPLTNLALFVYGDALRQQGQLSNAEQALSQLQSRLETGKGNSREAAFYHYGMGELSFQKGDYDRAEKEHRAAFEILRVREPRSPYMALLLGAIARVEESKNDLPAALADYAEAIRLMDSFSAGLDRSSSIQFLVGRAQFSVSYASLLLKQGKVRESFAALDHSHAQTLMQTLSANRVNLRSRAPRDLRLKDQKLETQLSGLSEQRVRALAAGDQSQLRIIDKKIAECATDHDLVEAQLRAADQGYALLTRPVSPNVRQIQNSLDPGTALLEYSLDKQGSLLFAMDRDRLLSFRLRDKAELDNLVRATYNKFSRSGKAKETDTADLELSDAILGPAAAFLKGHRKLLIVADGSLHYIPFAALPLPHAFGGTGAVLGSRFETANLPSASFLCLPSKASRPGQSFKSIAVLADPVFTKADPRVAITDDPQAKQVPLTMTASRGVETAPSSNQQPDYLDLLSEDKDDSQTRSLNLKRLLHSREEAAAIAAVSPKQNLVMAVDFTANRATALAPKVTNSRIIHFATHGVFDSKNPAMSGLVFSLVDKQGKAQAGFLGLDDIYRLRLSADLVVMSACETALGEEVKGEGLVGLTWGFIYAGAKSVVASLWRVDDASTAELMRIFYTGIEREGLTPAAALRKAQMAIASQPKWSAPYYWAGFVVQGQYAKD